MSESDVEVQFGGNASGAIQSMSEVRHALLGLVDPIRGVYDNVGELAEAFAAAFAVEKIAEFVSHFAELGEQITRTSAMIGVSTKEVQELSYVSEMTGGTAEGLSNAIQRLELGLQNAQNPTSRQAQALKSLGLSAKELIAIPVDQQLSKIADAVSRFADGGNKTAIVMALMGRSGAQMIPLLDKGAAGFDEMAERADGAAAVMSGPTVAALDTLEQYIVTLGASFKAMGGTIVGEMAPAFEGLVLIVTNLVAAMTRSVQQGGIMKYVLDFVASSVASIDVAFAAAIGVVQAFWDVCIEAAQTIASIWNGVGRIMYDVFTFKWSDVSAAWGDFESEMQSHAKQMVENIAGDVNRATAEIKTALGLNAPESAGGSKPQAPALNVNASQGASAAKTAIDAQIKVLQDGLAAKKTIWEEEAKISQITANQEFGYIEGATQKEYEAELALLKKELGIGNLQENQKAQINAKIEELEAKHNADMVKLDEQSIAAQQKAWQGYFNTVEGAFNGQLKSLLNGSETFSQAFGKILGDLVIKFIEAVEKMVFNWLAGEVAKTTATQTGAAARLAAEQSAQAGGIMASLANVVKSIMSFGGQTAAGVSAEVAPIAGPAAPAIGAAAGAATVSEALALVPHAVGSWEVPGITPALLHPGEMVIPQTFAEGLRNVMNGAGGAGGSPQSVSVSVSAWDGASVNSWLRQGGASLLATHITNAMQNNPSLRPSYET